MAGVACDFNRSGMTGSGVRRLRKCWNPHQWDFLYPGDDKFLVEIRPTRFSYIRF